MTTQKIKLYDDLSNVTNVAKNLWEVDQCFGDKTAEWLESIFINQGNEFTCDGLKRRLSLKYTSKDFERLNSIGPNLCESIGSIVGHTLKFSVVKYWIDLPLFGCQLHQDAEDIFVSYQVYLGSTFAHDIYSIELHNTHDPIVAFIQQNPETNLVAKGAEFLHELDPVQIQFKSNHGYINLNSDLKLHQVISTWDTRRSVMFQFARV
jgi:hypothetical protein